mmetsp:Transcript_38946/g.87518  ORF Transcript_38946/g.87518 Transcript_38946/m.87518 type:complete len:222 (-) Transcript_38946:485-1150(-)
MLGRGAISLVMLQGSDGDACATIIRRADNLCKRIATLQVYRVLLPSHRSIGKLLGHNDGPLLGLENDIEATVRCLLNVLGDLHNPLRIQDARLLLIARLCRIDDADNLPAIGLLGRSHLKATQLIDTEPGLILGLLVKGWRRRLQDLLENLCFHFVFRARLQSSTRSLLLPMCDLEVDCPRRWEQRAGTVNGKLGAEEVVLSPLLYGLFLLNELVQCLHVG